MIFARLILGATLVALLSCSSQTAETGNGSLLRASWRVRHGEGPYFLIFVVDDTDTLEGAALRTRVVDEVRRIAEGLAAAPRDRWRSVDFHVLLVARPAPARISSSEVRPTRASRG